MARVLQRAIHAQRLPATFLAHISCRRQHSILKPYEPAFAFAGRMSALRIIDIAGITLSVRWAMLA